VTDYLMPKNNPGVAYVISEVSLASGQGGPLLGYLVRCHLFSGMRA
jgi:hypothetical protein